MKTEMILLVFFALFLACSAKEKLISVKDLKLGVVPAKRTDNSMDQKNGQFKIYRTDPIDENFKTTYWLRVFPVKNIKFDSPDFVVSSNKIYDQARYKWTNDSTVVITLVNLKNHDTWRWTIIKNAAGCKFKKEHE